MQFQVVLPINWFLHKSKSLDLELGFLNKSAAFHLGLENGLRFAKIMGYIHQVAIHFFPFSVSER